MGAELVNRYLADMKTDLQRTRGTRKFVDVAAEGEPRFPTTEEADEDREVAQLRLVEDDEPPPLTAEPEAASDDENQEPEPVDAQSQASSSGNSGRRVSRRQRRQDTAPARDSSRDSSAVSEPHRERGASLQQSGQGVRNLPGLESAARQTRETPYPYPFDQLGRFTPYFVSTHYLDIDYQQKPDHHNIEDSLFTAQDSMAQWSRHEQSFFIKKAKRLGDEIDISKLAPEIQKRFTGPGGSREKEWKKVGNGIKVH